MEKENMKSKLQVGDIVDVLRTDTNVREVYVVGCPTDIEGVINDLTYGRIKIINVQRPVVEQRSEVVEELISIQNTKPIVKEPVLNEYEIYCLIEMINSIIEFGMVDLRKDDLIIVITKMSQPSNKEELESKEIMIQFKTSERVLLYQVMKESLRLNFAKLEMGAPLTIEDVFKDCNVVVTQEGYLNYCQPDKENTTQCQDDGSNTADELVIS